MSSSTSPTKALCLLLVVALAYVGAASAAGDKPLPGSCLMAASTLCADADTNAMRCLRTLAMKSDTRVPSACSEAVMAGVTVNPRFKNQASRAKRLARMLNEGGACTGVNTCVTANRGQSHQQCNDVAGQCECRVAPRAPVSTRV